MFKKIKSLFVIEENITTEKSSGSKSKKTDPVKKSDAVPGLDVSDASISKASLDKFLKVLADAMENANMVGYDYMEFKQAVRSLDKLETDEEKRYITSYALAKTMGAQKEQLKKSAGFYLDILQKEHEKFNLSLKNQVETRVEGKELVILGLREKKLKKEENIQKLQEEIAAIDAKLLEVQQQKDGTAQKLASVQKSFTGAYDLIVNQIKQDISKIDQYLKSE